MADKEPLGYERLAELDKACDPTGSGILAQARRHRLASAALIGGAVAATAGAVYAAQTARRRKVEEPVNEIMQTAITATSLKEASDIQHAHGVIAGG